MSPSPNRATLERLFERGEIDLRRSPLFETPPPPLPASFGFGRVEGMLLGLAVGDALGNTTEGMLPGQRLPGGEIRDYLPNPHAGDRPVGLPSDDSQLAFWTLEQVLADGRLDPERLAERFAGERIFGIGQTVRAALDRYRSGTPWHRCGPRSAGNGALMRIAPVLVPHLRAQSADLWVDTALAAMLTHNDSGSTAACLAFVRMLWEALGREEPPAPEWWLETYVETARELEAGAYRPRKGAFMDYEGPIWRFVEEKVGDAYRRGLTVGQAGTRWYAGAFLLETVPCVLLTLMRHADDPEEAIARAVNDTRDNDTIAAIVGAAVGALHGREGLPDRWIEGLLGRTREDDDGRIFELLEEARRAFWGC